MKIEQALMKMASHITVIGISLAIFKQRSHQQSVKANDEQATPRCGFKKGIKAFPLQPLNRRAAHNIEQTCHLEHPGPH